jgi:hypothetical protein
MANDFYGASGAPATRSAGTSAAIRNEFGLIQAAFDKMPALSGNALKLLRVNAAGSAIEVTTSTTGDFVLKAGDTMTGPLTATGFIGPLTGAVTGNASTATALQTPRTINGVSFDGTGNIVVAASAGTLTGSTLAAGVTASSLTSVGTLASLTVAGTAAFNGGVTLGDAAGDALTINSNTANIPNGLALNNGNVGIGGTPTVKLDVIGGNARIIQSGFVDPVLTISQGSGVIGQKGQFNFSDNSGTTSFIYGYGSSFGSGNNYALAFGTNGAERARFDSAGNFQIAQSSAAVRKVEVNAIPVAVSQLNGIRVQAAGDATYAAELLLGTDGGGVPFASIRTGSNGNSYLTLFTTGSERARLDASGNFIVGGTAVPLAAANRGLVTINGATSALLSLTVAGASRAYLAADASSAEVSSAGYLALTAGGSERARYTAAGEYLLGTTTTQAGYLCVSAGNIVVRRGAASNAILSLAGNNTTPGTASFDLQMDGSSNVDIVNRSNTRMSFYTNGAEVLRLTAAGLIQDAVGNELGFKGLPSASVATGAFVAADRGKCIYATAGVTIPNSTMAAGDVVVVQNTTGGSLTITKSVTTAYNTATGGALGATFSLLARGRMAIVFTSSTECYVSGNIA